MKPGGFQKFVVGTRVPELVIALMGLIIAMFGSKFALSSSQISALVILDRVFIILLWVVWSIQLYLSRPQMVAAPVGSAP